MSNVIFVSLLLLLTLTTSYVLYFTKGHLVGKFVLVAALFVFASAIYYSFESYKGWPTEEKVISGQLVWAQVREPEAIYIWVNDDVKPPNNWFEENLRYVPPNRVVPRAYKLPFSKDTAKEYMDAINAIKNGDYVRIEYGVERDEYNAAGNGKRQLEGDTSSTIRIIELQDILKKNPDPLLEE